MQVLGAIGVIGEVLVLITLPGEEAVIVDIGDEASEVLQLYV